MIEEIAVFSVGVIVTVLAAVGVALYMRSHLYKILIDLCGTEERAKFWQVFSNVTLIMIPLLSAISFSPNFRRYDSIFFELIDQLKLGLFGLIATVIVLGFMMSRYIPPMRPAPTNKSSSEPKV